MNSKDELIQKLNNYATSPDDDSIMFKEYVKQELLKCPELLFALNNKEYEDQLFNEDGTINEDGDWDLYFNDNIRPYLYYPESQTDVKNFLSYKVEFEEIPRYNKFEKIARVYFVVLCDIKTIIDVNTGIARHDLIASILRERFHWSNIFGTQCKIVNNKETVTDSNYVTRTLILELTIPNSPVNSNSGLPRVINNVVRTGSSV